MGRIERFKELEQDPRARRDIHRYMLRDLVSGQILTLMEKKGISKAQLAKLLGTSRAHVSNLLRGDRNMTLDTLSDIALALGCTVDFILRPEGEKSRVVSFHTVKKGVFYTAKEHTEIFSPRGGEEYPCVPPSMDEREIIA